MEAAFGAQDKVVEIPVAQTVQVPKALADDALPSSMKGLLVPDALYSYSIRYLKYTSK